MKRVSDWRKSVRVELTKDSCEPFAGFEVRLRKWNQRLKADLRAFYGLFRPVSSPKRVPPRTRLCRPRYTAMNFIDLTISQNPREAEKTRQFCTKKYWIIPMTESAL